MTVQALDRAADYATCQMLGSLGANLVGAAVWTAPAIGKAALVPLGLGGLSYIAQQALCAPQDLGEIPSAPGGMVDGCAAVTGYGELEVYFGGNWITAFPPGNFQYSQGRSAVEINEAYVTGPNPSDGKYTAFVEWYTAGGQLVGSNQYRNSNEQLIRDVRWRINPLEGTCGRTEDPNTPQQPVVEDVTYVDESTNCTFNVKFDGFYAESPNAVPGTVWTIEEITPSRLSAGGRICLLYTSPSPRDYAASRMPSSA